MNPTSQITRRNFVTTTALAAAATVAAPTLARAEATERFKVIVFSKAFATYSPDETADLLVDVGWDGIECPVRAKAGQIAPEKVEEDLPKMVEALKKRGKEVTIVTTEIVKVDPLAEKVLRTTAKLGVKKHRVGFVKDTADKPVTETVQEVGAALKELAALNREL